MSLPDDASKNAIVQELTSNSRVCVVYQPDVAEFWIHSTELLPKPLVHFVRENFETVSRVAPTAG
jgi:hypothetical protein